MYRPSQNLAKQVEAKLVANGTMARIDATAARNSACAQSLGYDNAQQAFNALGKPFLVKAKSYVVLTESVAKAVSGFVSLVSLGWEVELAFECSYDGVFDEIEKEKFLDLCQSAVKEKQQAANN